MLWKSGLYTNQRSMLPIATETELLDFVNKGRDAGGANLLEALLPSIPQMSGQCLIARGLNFHCDVQPGGSREDGEWIWWMMLPHRMGIDSAMAVAKALGCNLTIGPDGDMKIELPSHIGNAARAFDKGLAFQNLVE